MSAPTRGNGEYAGEPRPKRAAKEKPTGEMGAHQLADMYFDGAIPPSGRSELEQRLAEDETLRQEFRATRELIEKLRGPVAFPDQTDAILSRVEQINGFTTAAVRRKVWKGRIAIAACMCGVLGVAVALRVALSHDPVGPAGLRASSGVETTESAKPAMTAKGSPTGRAPASLVASAPGGAVKRRPLEMTGVSKYDAPSSWQVSSAPASSSGTGVIAGPVVGPINGFVPDHTDLAAGAGAAALNGMITPSAEDPVQGLKNAEALLKIDRPWWLWPLQAGSANKPVPASAKPAKK